MSKAFRFHQHGGPEVLRFEDVEVRAPGPGAVRMRNVAVAVNYRDVLMRKGVHAVKSLPSPIGLESAGVVEAIGPEVTGFAVGDRVAYAGMPEGSYAELRVVPTARLIARARGHRHGRCRGQLVSRRHSAQIPLPRPSRQRAGRAGGGDR